MDWLMLILLTCSEAEGTDCEPTMLQRPAEWSECELQARMLERGMLYGGTGRANPTWLAWLMGFPADWLPPRSKPSATRSSRKSPTSSAAPSCKRSAHE